MSVFLTELLIILFLVTLNGIFALSELAIVSSRRARLLQMVEEGNKGAAVALELAESPNRFLSTVQIGITLIGILAGAFGGATLSELIAEQIAQVPALQDASEAIGVAIVVAITTYLSLIIGELVPKRLAMQNPERIAVMMARPMNLLSKIASPLVSLLSLSTDLLLRLMGVKETEDDSVTEAEILSMIEEGEAFHKTERELVEGVFRLDDVRVEGLMQPRNEIIWLDVNAAANEIRATITEHVYGTYPVCRGDVDHVVGVVRAKYLLQSLLAGQPIDLQSTLEQPVFIPETASATLLLERFKTSGLQFALVVDEYGGIKGLVTLGNVLKELVGDIVEPDDPHIVQRDDGTWLVDGRLPVHRLTEISPDFELPEEELNLYSTFAGFVMLRLGRIPTEADHFEWGKWSFEVVDMDGNQIDKIIVRNATLL